MDRAQWKILLSLHGLCPQITVTSFLLPGTGFTKHLLWGQHGVLPFPGPALTRA